MKKIGKLSISPEKVINNEKLVNLKGGVRDEDQTGCCNCMFALDVMSVIVGSTEASCDDDCQAISPGGFWFGDWVC